MSDRETIRDHEAAGTGEAYDSEIGYGLLLKLGFGLLAIVVVSAVLMYFLFGRFLAWERAAEPEPPVLIEVRTPVPAPGAKLLPDPELNLDAYEAQVRERLHGYGWADEARGTVHIPIDRAIEIVAERGLPARAERATEPDETQGRDEPAEAEGPRIEAVSDAGADGAEDDDAGDETEAGSRPEDGD